MSEEQVVEKKRSIADRLAAVRRNMNALENDARNQHHKYNYTSSEKIIGAASAALAEEGLSVLPIESNIEPMGNGCKLSQKWGLIAEGEETVCMERQTYCEEGKGRPLDKVVQGASTVNLSYLLRDLCGIERTKGNGQEIRPDERDDREYQPRQQRQEKNRFYDQADAQVPPEEQKPTAPPADYGDNKYFQTRFMEAIRQRGIDYGKAKIIAGAEAKNQKLKDYASATPEQRKALVDKVLAGHMDGFKTLAPAAGPDEGDGPQPHPPMDQLPSDNPNDPPPDNQHEADENECLRLWVKIAGVDATVAMQEMNLAIQRTTRSKLTFADMSAEQMNKWRGTLEKYGDKFISQWHDFALVLRQCKGIDESVREE